MPANTAVPPSACCPRGMRNLKVLFFAVVFITEYLFIYLLLAALGPHCSGRAFCCWVSRAAF